MKIKKLKIDLLPDSDQDEYEKNRLAFIADYTVIKGVGFFSSGYYAKDSVAGEAEWNKRYPKGIYSWKSKYRQLNSYGEQTVIDKINEIIETTNKLLPPKGSN